MPQYCAGRVAQNKAPASRPTALGNYAGSLQSIPLQRETSQTSGDPQSQYPEPTTTSPGQTTGQETSSGQPLCPGADSDRPANQKPNPRQC